MVLVIIILVAWAVILGPSLLKRRARSGGHQSITHFHHQLRILEHSAPEPIVAPAYRLRAVDDTGTPTGITYPDTGTPPKLTVVGAKELPRPALAFLGEPPAGVTADRFADVSATATSAGAPYPTDDPDLSPSRSLGQAAPGRPRPPVDGWAAPGPAQAGYHAAPRADGSARGQARRRRRDTLVVLAGAFVLALLLAVVTGMTALWALCALDAAALGAYVALLVHLRRLAMEREHKLHYLDARDDPRRVLRGGLPTQVSGRYAHPSNQQAIAR